MTNTSVEDKLIPIMFNHLLASLSQVDQVKKTIYMVRTQSVCYVPDTATDYSEKKSSNKSRVLKQEDRLSAYL